MDSSSDDIAYDTVKKEIEYNDTSELYDEDLAVKRQCIANGININYKAP